MTTDVGQDMIAIVSEKGYVIETHYVTTSDGYILTMFRIPFGKKSSRLGGPPILLQHGLLDSSYTWVNNPETESLGYILANNGYDVW
jgi:pimeloyl-ACP methyl ester carboxylesterase